MSRAAKPSTAAAGGGARPEVPAPTDRILFRLVSTENPAVAVARRIRAAIALGLLGDGDRLPREAELARRLGVTVFATREALGELRAQGLIATRAGKNGGSFVQTVADPSLLASGELTRMSAVELRDLGDWRQMVASVSAALAAQRASAAQIAWLRAIANELRGADSVLAARRAHARFHIELAGAAQSTRMAQAELEMYESFDWLFGLALADPERRRANADELSAVVDAVERRSPDDARVATERHSAATVDALVRLRLAALAARADHGAAAGSTVTDEVTRVLAVVRATLERIATLTAAAIAEDARAEQIASRLARAAMTELVDSEPALDGLGFIAEPGAIRDRGHWIAWWHVTAHGVTADHSHVLDPSRLDFYDYTAHDYFARPRGGSAFHAQGPYLDHFGTGDHTMTFAVPVVVGDAFVGIAAADVSVSAFEHHLAPWLAATEQACVIINADRRVIAANTGEYTLGDLYPDDVDGQADAIDPVAWLVVHGTAAP